MAYRLKLPHWMKQLHPVFNIVKLTLAPEDPIIGRRTEDHPLPIVIDREAEWEVEDVRATGHKTPGESSVNITVSVYDTTHLQENPQRIG